MKTKLWSLTLGNFAIGTGALIVPGMLNELSADLAVTPAAIGVVISAFAMTICVGGPFLAGWTSALERRVLLTAALLLYAVMHILAACAPGYLSLMAIRVVTAIGAALFTAQAAATAGLLVPAEQRGKAIGLVFLGWSIAAVVGMPVGAYLGAHIGWRLTIALVGGLSALFALWVWLQIPARLFVPAMDKAAWKSLYANKPLLLAISVTAIQGVGQFTLFSYIAAVLKEFIQAGPTTISVLFACFGVTGVIGNLLASRFMDRLGTTQVGLYAMGCMCLAQIFWPLTRDSLGITTLLMLLWGLGCFALNGVQQARLVEMAPALAPASVSLNSSAIYLGQALGALTGGAMISAGHLAQLSIVGAVLLALAMLVSQFAARMSRRIGVGELA
ncbi:MFS transporter [Undibacterium sp.]|jgi:predicted MFS family arabinose efflux permease|uniref:MFS transporter n=1 Tax=Undibacterium sp. TaxID=1914977 RepID=UPI002C164D3B|nr:MFS transporter [Undibacterium sp.]HTD04077.1 MFS transporter [Undibacterium sp.]